MSYKVGDKVKVRTWESMEREFGLNLIDNIETPLTFVKGMKKHCGCTLTISRINQAGNYYVNEDGNAYQWSDEMFEPVEQLLTPDEVWKWLCEHYCDSTFDEVFNDDYLRAADDDVYFYDMVCKLTFTEVTEKVSSYVNEQKKPKGLNMDIVCIKSKSGHFAEGKKYEVRDGYFITDTGDKYGNGTHNEHPYASLDGINADLNSKFIELVEE